MTKRWTLFSLLVFTWANVAFAASQTGITYQGRILKPDGSPLSGSNVQFRLQIRTPNSSDCLMYEEIQSLDMRNMNGQFSLTINDGSGARTDATALGLDRIFANYGNFTFDPATCMSGSSYTPSLEDGRRLVVLFKDETMAIWEPIPAQMINYVPFAIQASQLAGFAPTSILRVQDPGGAMGNFSPLSNAQYTKLMDLIDGSSSQYTKAGQLNGVALPTMTSGEVLGWNGTTWVSQAATSGPNSITTTMIQSGAVDGTKLDPAISISTSGMIASAVTTTRDFKIYAASPSTFYVGMLADPALAASYTLTWPLTAGSANQVLTSDGSGKLTWTTPSSAGITALTGDVTATGPGPAAATVVSVGGSAAADINTAELAANAATYLNTPNTIVKRDGTGGFAAGAVSATSVSSSSTIAATGAISGASVAATGAVTGASAAFTGSVTQGSSVFKDTATNTVTVQAPANVTSSYVLKWPTSAGGSGDMLTTDASGNLSWTSPLSSSTAFVQGGNTFGANADLGTNDGFDLNLRTGGTTKMTVTSGGRVGIGTTDPKSNLDVNGAIRATGSIAPASGSGIELSYWGAQGNVTAMDRTTPALLPLNLSGKNIYFGTGPAATYSNRMSINSDGKIKIGTGYVTPVTLLDVDGSIRVGDGGETCDASLTGAIRYNGGNLQFCAGAMPWTTLGTAGSGLTALTGDVTASGTGSVTATVASVGGVTAANVGSGANAANAATDNNTVSTIVKRDASGNFSAGAITQGSAVFKSAGANTVTVQAPASVTSSYVLAWPTSAGGSDQVLKTDVSGQLSWTSLPTALPPNGAAGGDLSGTYPNPTVATVGGSTAANINSAELLANAATAANTSNAIVKRDGTGNFTANVGTFNGVALNNAGSIVNIVNPTGAGYTLTLPTGVGSSGQFLTTDGTGLLSWSAPSTLGDFMRDGSVSMTGQFKAADGTAGAPGITFASDPDTGIFKGGTPNYLYFSSGGVNAMQMSSGGLDVFTGITSRRNGSGGIFRAANADAPSAADDPLGLYSFGGSTYSDRAYLKAYASQAWTATEQGTYLTLATTKTGSSSAGERVRITDSGNVGIGTTNPTSTLTFGNAAAPTIGVARSTGGAAGADLTIAAGSATLGSSNTNAGDLILSSGTSTGNGSSNIKFQTGGGYSGSSENTPTTVFTINNVGGWSAVSNANGSTGGFNFKNASSSSSASGAIEVKNNASSYIGMGVNSTTNVSAQNGGLGSMAYITANAMNGLAITAGVGPSSTNTIYINTSGGERMRITPTGSVGIGTTAPRSTLEIGGTLLVKPSVLNSTSTIDFSTGNLQHTSNSCGTFNFHNMQDGGSYTFAVKGTTSSTCLFNAYKDAGSTSLTVHMPPDHAATVAGTHTLYTLLVMGGDVYVTWIPGL